jgi:hypothetical protein
MTTSAASIIIARDRCEHLNITEEAFVAAVPQLRKN